MVPILLAAVIFQAGPAGSSDIGLIRQSADTIMACAQPDGLIRLYPSADAQTVRPYFSNMAALGLLRAYQASSDRRYLAAAIAAAAWYASHQNPDGTTYDVAGTPGAQRATRDYDSSDAYPATFLVLTREIFAVTRDKAWVQSMRGAVQLALKGIKLTWQGDGLTWAKPSYRIKYLMDNLEVRQGLRAAADLAAAWGDGKAAGDCTQMLSLNCKGLLKLWNTARHHWAVGLDEAGNPLASSSSWYPDGMADAMALCYFVGAADQKGKRLAESLVAKYPDAADFWFIMALGKFDLPAARGEAIARHAKQLTNSLEHAARIRFLVPARESFLMDAGQLGLP
jgi:hypothetical protein